MNKEEECIHKKASEERKVRYTTKSILLIGYMEEKDCVLKVRGWAAFGLVFKLLYSLMTLNGHALSPMYTMRRGRYLLTGDICWVQYGHNTFQSSKIAPLGYFVILKGAEGAEPYVR